MIVPYILLAVGLSAALMMLIIPIAASNEDMRAGKIFGVRFHHLLPVLFITSVVCSVGGAVMTAQATADRNAQSQAEAQKELESVIGKKVVRLRGRSVFLEDGTEIYAPLKYGSLTVR